MTAQMEGYKASNPAPTGLSVLIEKDSCRFAGSKTCSVFVSLSLIEFTPARMK